MMIGKILDEILRQALDYAYPVGLILTNSPYAKGLATSRLNSLGNQLLAWLANCGVRPRQLF
ncbi:hypothetical protein ACFLTP_01165 [Chloroflexota bacterium]